MYDYLIAVAIGFCLWAVALCLKPKYFRNAVFCGLLIAPLVVVDYLMVPTYWQPVTLGNIPVGIEGVLVTFFMAGVAYILYACFRGYEPKHRNLYWRRAIILIPLAASVFVLCYALNDNFIYGLFVLFLLSFVYLVWRQPQLLKPGLLSAVSFGLLYFLAFSLWQILAPATADWWNYANLWGIKIGLLPAEEVVFGILFGLVVGALFDYITEPASKLKGKSQRK